MLLIVKFMDMMRATALVNLDQTAAAQNSQAAHQRCTSLKARGLQQNNRETDIQSLTTDGTLNTKNCYWQGETVMSSHSLPLWLQVQIALAKVQTNWNGYVQSCRTPTTFRAAYTQGASAVVTGLLAKSSDSRHTQLGEVLAWSS